MGVGGGGYEPPLAEFASISAILFQPAKKVEMHARIRLSLGDNRRYSPKHLFPFFRAMKFSCVQFVYIVGRSEESTDQFGWGNTAVRDANTIPIWFVLLPYKTDIEES